MSNSKLQVTHVMHLQVSYSPWIIIANISKARSVNESWHSSNKAPLAASTIVMNLHYYYYYYIFSFL